MELFTKKIHVFPKQKIHLARKVDLSKHAYHVIRAPLEQSDPSAENYNNANWIL